MLKDYERSDYTITKGRKQMLSKDDAGGRNVEMKNLHGAEGI
jgi:hypothetical protein